MMHRLFYRQALLMKGDQEVIVCWRRFSQKVNAIWYRPSEDQEWVKVTEDELLGVSADDVPGLLGITPEDAP